MRQGLLPSVALRHALRQPGDSNSGGNAAGAERRAEERKATTDDEEWRPPKWMFDDDGETRQVHVTAHDYRWFIDDVSP